MKYLYKHYNIGGHTDFVTFSFLQELRTTWRYTKLWITFL